MPDLPSSLALTTIADGSKRIAAPVRNNFTSAQTAVNALIAALAGGTVGQVLRASDADTVTWAHPPGYEYDYAEFTSDKTTTATTAAGATTVVAGNAVTYDGATPVWVEFFAPYGINVSGQLLNIELYDGASAIDTLCSIGSASVVDGGVFGKRKITPSAAAHTYTVKAWNGGAGTGTVKAGAGGSGVLVPGFIRVTKV